MAHVHGSWRAQPAQLICGWPGSASPPVDAAPAGGGVRLDGDCLAAAIAAGAATASSPAQASAVRARRSGTWCRAGT